MKKTRLIFAGTPEFAKVALQYLIDYQESLNIEIVAVYTQPDRRAGRGQKMTMSPVKVLAMHHNLPVEQPPTFSLKSADGQQAREALASYRPDVMVVAAYGLILPLGVLNTPVLGCLNIHASLLPRWRGAAPIQRAILAGDTTTGITVMQMARGLDTGDMLYHLPCDIDVTDTTQSLHDKLADLGGQAIIAVLKDVKNYQAEAKKQDDALANYANKITTEEGLVDFSCDALSVQRQIRALSSYAFLRGERIKLLSAKPICDNQTTTELAGKVVGVGKNAILVACGANSEGVCHLINLSMMQWAGGKPLTAEQIANSNKISEGDVFTTNRPAEAIND